MSDKKPTLLIVDDEPPVLEIIAEIAAKLDVRSLTAGNGVDALAIVEKEHVDVIISDLNMPAMDGLTLLSNLPEKGYFWPFIILTGYGDKERSIQALRLGAYDFQEKPLDTRQLQAIIMDAVEYSTSLQEKAAEISEKPDESTVSLAKLQMRRRA